MGRCPRQEQAEHFSLTAPTVHLHGSADAFRVEPSLAGLALHKVLRVVRVLRLAAHAVQLCCHLAARLSSPMPTPQLLLHGQMPAFQLQPQPSTQLAHRQGPGGDTQGT